MAEVKILISAEDQASAALQKMNASLKTVQGAAESVASAFGAYKLAQFISDSTMLAARNETLGVVLKTVGANAGYTAQQVNDYATGVQKMGITVEQSRMSIIRMSQANLDLTKSSQLARLSQDAAVIAGMTSSQALEGILHGITTLQPEVLRTYGIVVNFEQAYAKAAATMGRSVDSLTQAEKQQIAMNAVLEQGKNIAGTYEASLGTVGKALQSLKRYVEDNKAAFGEMFTPALKVMVDEFTNILKGVGDWFIKNKDFVKDFAKTLADDLTGALKLAKDVLSLLPGGFTDAKTAATAFELVVAGMAATTLLGITRMITALGELRTAFIATAAVEGASSAGGAAGKAGMLATLGRWGLIAGTGIVAYKGTQMALNATADATGWEWMSAYRTPAAAGPSGGTSQSQIDSDNAQKAAEGRANLAKKQAEDAAFLQQQLDKKTQEARLKLDAERDKLATEQIKVRGEFELNALKFQHDQGLASAEDYYRKVNELAYQSALEEYNAREKQRSRINSEMGKGTTTPEQRIKLETDLIQLDQKAVDSAGKLAKVYQDSDQSRIKDLKQIHELMLTSAASRLTDAGQYVKALQTEIDKEKQSVDYLKIVRAAEQGNSDAIAVLKDKEIAWRQKNIDMILKEKSAQESKATAAEQVIMNDLINKGLVEEAFQLQKQIDLRANELKRQQEQAGYEKDITDAISSGNYQLEERLRKAQSITQEMSRWAEYAILDRQFSSAQQNVVVSSPGGSGGMIDNNAFPSDLSSPFLGGFAVGTNYVPRDGFAYLHEGEAVVPKKYNTGSDALSVGNINVTVNGGATGAETAKEIARKILPELRNLMPRYRMGLA